MKILFKTVCYQGRGRDRFQHSSALLPGKGGSELCAEPPGIPGKLLERGHRVLGMLLITYKGHRGFATWNKEWLNLAGLSKNGRTLDQRGLGDDRPLEPFTSAAQQNLLGYC